MTKLWNKTESITFPSYDCSEVWIREKDKHFLVKSRRQMWSGNWYLFHQYTEKAADQFPYQWLGEYSWYGNEKINPPMTWANKIINIKNRYGLSLDTSTSFRFRGRIICPSMYLRDIPRNAEQAGLPNLAKRIQETGNQLIDWFVTWRDQCFGYKHTPTDPDIKKLTEILYELDQLHGWFMIKMDIEDYITQPEPSEHQPQRADR